MSKIKILMVGPCSLSRIAISCVLSGEKDFMLLQPANHNDDLVPYSHKTNPDIFLLCFSFLIKRGKHLIAKIKEKTEKPRIVVFNCCLELEQELKLVREGIAGVISSDSSPEALVKALVKALRRVHAGEFWFKRELITSLLETHSHPVEVKIPENGQLPLTKREVEILAMIGEGNRNQDISSKLCIAPGTVKTHINSIYRKIEVNDRLQATFYAIKHNLLSYNR